MSKIFETDFENGSLIEKVSGNIFNKVSSPIFKLTKKGLGLYTKNGYITTSNFSYNPTNKISFEITTNVLFVNLLSQIFIYTLNSYSTPFIIVYRSGAVDGKNLYVYYWTGSAQTAVSVTNFFSTTGDYHIGITFDFSTGICIIYKNGTLFGTYNATTPQFPNLNYTLSLFGGTDQNQYINYGVKYYDHILSNKEVVDGYQEFLNSKPIVKTKTKIIYPPILAQKTDGLVAEYNFVNVKKNIVVNEAPSSSANGNNPTQYNSTSFNGLKKIDSVRYISSRLTLFPTINNLITIQAQIRVIVGNQTDFLKLNSSNYISFSLSSTNNVGVSGGEIGGASIYVNGVSSTVFVRYSWFTVSIISQNTINANLIRLGFFNLNSNFEIKNLRFYNRAISTQEIQDYHNQYATQPILLEDFSDYAVNTFPNKNWKKGGTTGIYVSQLTSDVTKFPELVKGTKYMLINGTWNNFTKNVKIPRGSTIEWYWSGNNTSSSSQSVYFIDSIGNSYLIQILSDRTIRFVRILNIVQWNTLYQGTTTYTNNIWYKMKLILNTNNTLSLYVDDVMVTTTVANTEIIGINKLQFNSAFQSVANIKITEGIIV